MPTTDLPEDKHKDPDNKPLQEFIDTPPQNFQGPYVVNLFLNVITEILMTPLLRSWPWTSCDSDF